MYLVQSGLGRDQSCELTLLEYSGIVWCLLWLCSSLWQLTLGRPAVGSPLSISPPHNSD